MSSEGKQDGQLEIAHVLFIDIVGYSKLPINRQSELLQQLNQIVRATEQFGRAEAADKLVRLPTGDGMALAFFSSPDAPVKCAIEISKAIGQAGALALQLRMGINSGPVDAVPDVNDRSNIAGAGINMAQRVMDCGDAGHILLSKRVADDLGQYEDWQPYLHELGVVEVKHGVRVEVVNFYDEEVGNPQLPEEVKRVRKEQSAVDHRVSSIAAGKRVLIVGLLLLVVAGIAGSWLLFYRVAPHSTSPVSLPMPDKSIAVLPLQNLSEDKENAFFADGIQDDILTSLSKISDLKVISRTSVLQYRGAGAAHNLREIAQALGVANVLEGSVRRVGNRVLVNVQLIDARNDRHIWAERYDRTVADSIGIQGELATEIAGALRAKLAPEEKARLEAKPTNNSEAYLLYLNAVEREGMVNASTEDLIAAERLYVQASLLDPKFALAYARASLLNSSISNGPDDRVGMAKARAQAEEAVKLAPDLGDAHLALGLCLYWNEKDYSGALKEFAIAAAASPNDAQVLTYIGGIYRRQGRWRESIASYQRAQELDPRNRSIVSFAGVNYMLVRDWSAAAGNFKGALEIAPDSVFPKIALAYLEVFRNGTPASARDILRKIPAGVDPDGMVTEAKWDLAMLERDFLAAEKIVADFPGGDLADFPHSPGWSKSFYRGQVALARGDVAQAQRFFSAAAPDMEAWLRNHSDNADFHDTMALLNAYMGRKENAIREARRSIEIEPENLNAFHGTLYLGMLAQVYALTGEADQAITLIERLLTTPGPIQCSDSRSITLGDLRLRWEWDSLRGNPRFQKILAGPEPKTIY
jgi:TolB-like protein/class 3 adenylate cyclase